MAKRQSANYGLAQRQWADRAREASRLRGTCVECGREGLPTVGRGRGLQPSACASVPVCVDDYGDAVYPSCPGRGHSLGEIAASIGVSRSTAGEYLTDPDRSKARTRRAKYHGTCVDCEGPTADRQTYRCQWCLAGETPPHLIESGKVRRFAPRPECGTPGCSKRKAPGRWVCSEHGEPLARVRRELDDGAEQRRRRGGLASLELAAALADEDPEAAALLAA